MIVRIVTCRVYEGTQLAFESATVENHRGSLTESGVLRFDVLKDSGSSNTYFLLEVYRDEDAVAAHKETGHYQTWRDTVAPMMQHKRESVACSVVAPDDEGQWRAPVG